MNAREDGPTPALRLAHAIDPVAFEVHEVEARSEVAAIQWAARRHIAHEHAVRVFESDWLAAHDEAIRAEEREVVWDEARAAKPQYLGPDDGHYPYCMGWEDCDCASYPNPYRSTDTEAS